jgi:hypothetical protein
MTRLAGRAMWRALPASAAFIAFVLAGCGGAGDPGDAVDSFFAAVADADGETACGLLTEEGRQTVLEGVLDTPTEGASCEEAVADAPEEARAAASDVEIEVTEESDTEATVEVTAGDDPEPVSFRVINVDGEWQIDGLAIADVVI